MILLTPRDEGARDTAERLYSEMQVAGIDALIDDRDERPGVKYKDAELTGICCRISVGSRDLADGVVEVTSRATGEKERVPVADAARYVRDFLARSAS